MVSQILFTCLILAVAGERLAELRVSQKNLQWSFARGGKEFAPGHYKAMVCLHTAFLLGALLEVWFFGREFYPLLGFPMLFIAVLAQGLRWWVINTLGPMWNTRIVVVPGLNRVSDGPFRYMRHPNYVAVAVEGLVLPLVHTAWVTALVFTAFNALLMYVRISEEEKALRLLRA